MTFRATDFNDSEPGSPVSTHPDREQPDPKAPAADPAQPRGVARAPAFAQGGGSAPLLVIATRNRKKGQELAELLDPPWEPSHARFGLRIATLDEYPQAPEVVEDAPTFAGNARKKASEAARALGQWVVADDSGLAVDALQGAPGVLSARYSGEHGDDDANNRKLLEALANVPDADRGAAFHCALAVADPSGAIRLETEAACRGRITHELRGPRGFGYDPLFLIREYHHTFGELSALVKHQLSHRARACARLRPGMYRLLAEANVGFS